MPNSLHAISPIDGRYHSKTEKLAQYFSEASLIKYRVKVEVEYFIALCEFSLPQLNNVDKEQLENLRNLYIDFTDHDAQRVKEIEKVTNHDVKAVEYFIKEKMDDEVWGNAKEFIHFGLTSQDINNTAIPMSLKDCMEEHYFPFIHQIIEHLSTLAQDWAKIPMLAKTHGQPASPTRLGKEIYVFVERLNEQVKLLEQVKYAGKFGGATGNFNAHHVAYPKMDWAKFGDDFLDKKLGISRSTTTTQIEHYDHMAALFDGLKRVNTILIDLCRDIWTYISMEYFKQKIKKGEVGSSAMPHKVNPIDFENAEGNLGLANAIFEHLSAKLPISRLQRDLTDSTVLRNIGVPIAHGAIAFSSIEKGLGKLLLNESALQKDLEDNWAVVAEAIQTILRREGVPNPYEMLKDLTRSNEQITADSIASFIDNLAVSAEIKEELRQISPSNYTGI